MPRIGRLDWPRMISQGDRHRPQRARQHRRHRSARRCAVGCADRTGAAQFPASAAARCRADFIAARRADQGRRRARQRAARPAAGGCRRRDRATPRTTVARRRARRPVSARRLPDRQRHQHQHERERGDRARSRAAALGTPVHPNDHVNMCQSSNDVIPSAIHVSAVLATRRELDAGAANTCATCCGRRSAHGPSVLKTGRTHLMDAMPMTLGQEVSGWRAQIDNAHRAAASRASRACWRWRRAARRSAPASMRTRSSRRRFIEELRALTGLPFTPGAKLLRGAWARRTRRSNISGQLRTLAVALMKIANDLRWMNSGPLAGLAELTLPALQPGSSIMPGKVNPVIPEAVAMIAAQVIGLDATIAIAGQSGNFQLNVMLPLIANNLLDQHPPAGQRARARSATQCIAGRGAERRAARRSAGAQSDSRHRAQSGDRLRTGRRDRQARLCRRAAGVRRGARDVGPQGGRIAAPARSCGADARRTARRRRPGLSERAGRVICAAGSCGASKGRSPARTRRLAPARHRCGAQPPAAAAFSRRIRWRPRCWLPLVDRPEGLTVLLTERASQLAKHAAQISFPGGRLETPMPMSRAPRCARRRRRSASIPARVQVFGYLPDHLVISGFRVTPVLSLVTPPFSLELESRRKWPRCSRCRVSHIFDRDNHKARLRRVGDEDMLLYDIPWEGTEHLGRDRRHAADIRTHGAGEHLNDEADSKAQRSLARLLDIMRRLRDPAPGCPWDREQDFASIAPYTIEEAYEVAEAIARGEPRALEGELGDLLFQVVFHAQMGAERAVVRFRERGRLRSPTNSPSGIRTFSRMRGSTPRPSRIAPGRSTRRASARHAGRVAAVNSPMCRWRCRRWRAPPSSANAPGASASIGPMRGRARQDRRRAARDRSGGRRTTPRIARRSWATCCSRSRTGRGISTSMPEEALRLANAKFERRFRAMEKLAADARLVLKTLDAGRLGCALERGQKRGKCRRIRRSVRIHRPLRTVAPRSGYPSTDGGFMSISSTKNGGDTGGRGVDGRECRCASPRTAMTIVRYDQGRYDSRNDGRYDNGDDAYDYATRGRRSAAGHAGARQHAAARMLG